MLSSDTGVGPRKEEASILLARIVTKLVGWAVSIFYDLERRGPALPEGPVLITANHPNALIDPLVVFQTAGRPSRPLAKAPLFDKLIVGTALRALGGLPVYRKQDDPKLMHLNDRTFEATIAALHAGSAVQIYPEGQSHSEPALTPIRTGAARIALLAEALRDWKLGLHVQPVGLTYVQKNLFRGRVVAAFGPAFSIDDLREEYEKDERVASRMLTDKIQEHLEAVTLNFEQREDLELVEVADRLYARGKGLVGYRERDRIADRLPRMQLFAKGIRWLRAADPERLEGLKESVRRYLRLLTLFGASEGDVPPRYKFGMVIRYSLRQLFMLIVVFPLAFLGAVAWLIPFILTRYMSPRFSLKLDQIATYKFVIAMMAFSIWWVTLTAAAYVFSGMELVLLVAAGLPVSGLAAIAWHDRQMQVRQDVRVFLRTLRYPRGQDRLAEQRRELVQEFDRLMETWKGNL